MIQDHDMAHMGLVCQVRSGLAGAGAGWGAMEVIMFRYSGLWR